MSSKISQIWGRGEMMEQKYTGYLFVFFTGTESSDDDEQVYFAVSRDGLHWKDLNKGCPVLRSSVGDGGVRDPFIVRSVLDGTYRVIATDLKIYSHKDWNMAANYGSTSLVIWESADLVHFNEPYTWDTGIVGAGCAWAPEVIFDEENSDYMIFWASMTKDKTGKAKQKIYQSHTKDFKKFTEPEIYIERDDHMIDTTIIKAKNTYYRFTKDEVQARIEMESGSSLCKEAFKKVESEVLSRLQGVEGPEIFKFNDRDEWCLIVDEVDKGTGYLPLVTSSLETGNFRILSEDEYDYGKLKKRHGSVINLTEEEMEHLKTL